MVGLQAGSQVGEFVQQDGKDWYSVSRAVNIGFADAVVGLEVGLDVVGLEVVGFEVGNRVGAEVKAALAVGRPVVGLAEGRTVGLPVGRVGLAVGFGVVEPETAHLPLVQTQV